MCLGSFELLLCYALSQLQMASSKDNGEKLRQNTVLKYSTSDHL